VAFDPWTTKSLLIGHRVGGDRAGGRWGGGDHRTTRLDSFSWNRTGTEAPNPTWVSRHILPGGTAGGPRTAHLSTESEISDLYRGGPTITRGGRVCKGSASGPLSAPPRTMGSTRGSSVLLLLLLLLLCGLLLLTGATQTSKSNVPRLKLSYKGEFLDTLTPHLRAFLSGCNCCH